MNEEPLPPKRKWGYINLGLLPLKLHFLLFFAGIASIVPYLPIYAKQLGISATGVGIVYFVIPVGAVITKPFFGWLADKFRRMKLLVIIMILTTIGFYIILIFIPSLKEKPDIRMTIGCENDSVVLTQPNVSCSLRINSTQSCQRTCSKYIATSDGNLSCNEKTQVTKVSIISTNDTRFVLDNSSDIVCSSNTTFYCDLYCPCEEWCCGTTSEYVSTQFWSFFVANVFAGMARRVIHSLSDSLCYDMLGGKTTNYGKQRLWGSIGRSLSPTVTGYLLDLTKYGTDYNYAVAIYVMVGLLLLDIIAVCRLDLSGNKQKEVSNAIWKDVCSLFSDLKHIIFSLSVTVNGVLCGLYFVYYFLFMKEIGASNFLIGVSVMVRLVSEVPCFFFAGRIIAKIGHFNAVIISFIAFSARFLSYVYITNPRWMLLAEVSHGFTFGFFYASMTSYAKRCAQPGTEATFQGLLGALFDGLGMAIGNILGGLGFDYCGSRTTFFIASIMAAISALFTFLLHFYVIWKRKQKKEDEAKHIEPTGDIAEEPEIYDEIDNML